MAAPTYLSLEISARGFHARVLFNEIPIVDDRLYVSLHRVTKLNGWCINGNNTLKVQLAKLLPVENKPLPQPRLTMRLRTAVPGTSDDFDRQLADFTWQAAQHPIVATAPTEVFSKTIPFNIPRAWLWTRGEVLTQPSPYDRSLIHNLLKQLHDALVRRAIPEILQLQAVQVGEQAVALGMSDSEALAGYSTFLSERMAASDWTVQPLPAPETLHYQSVAGGRVLHVAGPSGHYPISASSDDSTFAIDPYLTKVDGQWIIVR